MREKRKILIVLLLQLLGMTSRFVKNFYNFSMKYYLKTDMRITRKWGILKDLLMIHYELCQEFHTYSYRVPNSQATRCTNELHDPQQVGIINKVSDIFNTSYKYHKM